MNSLRAFKDIAQSRRNSEERAAGTAELHVSDAGNPSSGGAVEFSHVSKEFVRGDTATLVLHDVCLNAEAGEFLAIVGPSGCGKSTLLNLAAGLSVATDGEVLVESHSVRQPSRRLGYVTQADNLLPWRTVADNVALPLELMNVRPRARQRRVDEHLVKVGLMSYAGYYPNQLSGGMRKRVTLARSLVHEPNVLLMDEPFSALDAQLRLSLSAELLRLWRDPPRTVLYVTHDLVEAISLADRVVVMGRDPGRILAVEDVNIPRPRDIARVRFVDEFASLHERLWSLLAPFTEAR